VRALLAALTAGVLLSACAPTPDGGPGDATHLPGERVADVDTPQLRKLKATTDIPPCEPGSGTPVEGGLPDLTLPCLGGGEEVNLGSLRGPMVVNLWAQWCGPCKKEMPIYTEFHQRYGDRVGVLGIDFNDQRPDWALQLAKRSGTDYPQLADPAGQLIGPLVPPSSGLPIHLFIDEEGRLVANVAKAITSLDQLEGLVSEHLGVDL
jgi:thiol-disulfide isomerase/thioredoxin